MRSNLSKKKQTKGKCATEGCSNEVFCLGLCSPCYAFDRYWSKKNAAERRQRKEKLALFSERMDNLSPAKLRRVK